MSQGQVCTALLVRYAGGFIDVPALIVNTRTHRIAYSGPNGEPGFATDPGGGAVSWTMADGRVAWYHAGATPDPGNVEGLANYATSLTYGRIEGFLSLGSITDPVQAAFIAHGALGDHQTPMISTIVGLEPGGSGDNPYADFGIGDWITVPDPSWRSAVVSATTALPAGTIPVVSTTGFPTSGTLIVAGPPNASAALSVITYTGKTSNTFAGCTGGTGTLFGPAAGPPAKAGQLLYLAQSVQVEAITVTEDQEGNPIYVPELGTLSQELDVKLAAWLTMMTAGTLAGSVQTASPPPAPPVQPVPPADSIVDFHQAGPGVVNSNLSDGKAPPRSGSLYKVTAELMTTVGTTDTIVKVFVNGSALVTVTIPAGQFYTPPVLLNRAVKGLETHTPDTFSVQASSPGAGAVGLYVALHIK